MIRTGAQYLEGLKDGREVYIDGERVKDVASHPALAPIVAAKARMYDLHHEAEAAPKLTYSDADGIHSVFQQPPRTQEDWHRKWAALDLLLQDLGGVATRMGDETIGEMWSLQDGRDILAGIDPRFADNIDRHIRDVIVKDPFHVSANTDPKGDRSRPIEQRDPDMMIRVTKETDKGVIIRGAKFETAAPYADQAYLKPTVGAWTDEKESIHAVGCIVRMGAPGVKHICRAGFAHVGDPRDNPIASRFDEVEALVVFDDVLVPWEDVFFYRHTRAAQQVRATLHRYSAFPYVLRLLYVADAMIGVAMWNARQTGLEKLQAVQEKLADLVCYREGIRAHLAASIALAEPSPAGLLMPNQSILYAGRVMACSQLPVMMHAARELIGGQICVTPDAAQFDGEAGQWLRKFYTLNDQWDADDRRKLLAYARDLLNSGYAGHRLAFVQFAQAPHFNHLAAVYKSFDFSGPLDFVKRAASLSDKVDGASVKPVGKAAA
ncbi:4-hydroxyphenylacetate 3-hydroxylase family protein [Sabulicella glaciei]|uniref:4-hydroxyphenylacetate 3-hydroxylase family protein n=1 Tax=Sabulicella glaciei TaxID=2984948 RepID=A0ABT3NVT8_9PROT|nr:4-hydroxyphenylacetate 3-hydroxylase family protein [Roseococcus sp. MDT2-1-1]MCW8086276.1 4-hydroxyphenylacetate 3-hydroxylase family protein [Roseococcus sp. MDT2-1-1]